MVQQGLDECSSPSSLASWYSSKSCDQPILLSVFFKFRNDVVVVGVEPFFHWKGTNISFFSLVTTRPKQSIVQGQTSPSFEQMQEPR